MTSIFRIEYIRATIIAGLILASVEVFVRTDFFYELAPDSQAQEPIEIFDLGFTLITNPEIIVLGNSLTRNSISSFETTRLAAADNHFLLNLSQSAAEMSDQLWLYQRYRDKIRRADTLIIGIDFRSFDKATSDETGTSSRFRRYASIIQRLAVKDRSEKISLLAGSIWKTWDGRQQIRGYISDILRLRFDWTSKPRMDELGRFAVGQPITTTDVDDIVAQATTNYTFAKGVQFEAFTQLVGLAEEDSLKIILLETPATDVYLDQLYLNIGDEIHRLYDAIELETGIGIIQIALPEDDCPRVEDCFFDYGHMNANGSKIYTRLLLERLGIPSLPENRSENRSNGGND